MSELLTAIALLTALSTDLNIPRAMGVGVGQGEARLSLNPSGNDGGASSGLLQVHLATHGGPASRWTGEAGAIASINLMRARWATAARSAPTPEQWGDLSWEQQVTAFAQFWIAAQGARATAVWARAAEVLTETEALLAGLDEQQEQPMVTDPGIKWYKPAHPNGYTVGRPAGVLYEGLVYHTTAGGTTLEALADWFARPTTRAATWYGADPEGNLGQFVSLNNTAAANGLTNGIEHATARLVRENYALGVRDPNTYLIAIELLDGGKPGVHTAKQLEAAAHWGAWMWQEHIAPHAASTGAVVDRDHVLGHFEIDNKDRPGCPGWPAGRWDWMVERIKRHLAGPVVQPPPAPDHTRLLTEMRGWHQALLDNLQITNDLKTRLELQEADVVRKLAELGA